MASNHDNSGGESCRIQPEDQSDRDALPLKILDRLDKIAIFAIFALIAAASLVISVESAQVRSAAGVGAGSRQPVVIISPEFDNRLKLANAMLTNGNIPKARELIDGMISSYPYDGRPFMLMGDVYVHYQQPIEAMLEYRKGIDLNPDFLDKKAKEVFRGKQVKGVLNEAQQLIRARLIEKPGDPVLKEQLEILYYLLRRVAGSCG